MSQTQRSNFHMHSLTGSMRENVVCLGGDVRAWVCVCVSLTAESTIIGSVWKTQLKAESNVEIHKRVLFQSPCLCAAEGSTMWCESL